MKCDCIFFNKQNNTCELNIVLTYDFGDCEYNLKKLNANIDIFKEELKNFIIFFQSKLFEIESILEKDDIKKILIVHRKYKDEILNYKRYKSLE